MYHNAKRINILLAKKDKTLQRTTQQYPTVGSNTSDFISKTILRPLSRYSLNTLNTNGPFIQLLVQPY